MSADPVEEVSGSVHVYAPRGGLAVVFKEEAEDDGDGKTCSDVAWLVARTCCARFVFNLTD